MAKYTLNMVFGTSSDQKVNMTIADCKKDLSNATINSLMNTIIAQNVFESKFGDLKTKKSAKITESSVIAYDFD